MPAETVGRPMEILLVEDNLEDASVTMDALQQGNIKCRVTLVRDGEEAMFFLSREGIFTRAPRPDLILLDTQLPVVDGYEVIRQLKSNETTRSIPIIVLTESSIDKERDSVQVLGTDISQYVTKPLSIETLIREIQKATVGIPSE